MNKYPIFKIIGNHVKKKAVVEPTAFLFILHGVSHSFYPVQ